MRRVLLLAFAACSGGGSGGPVADDDPTECPASLVDNDPCSFAGQCWRDNTFSTCDSGFCTCEAGRVTCRRINHGDTCGDEPIDSCSTEGTPTCTTPPTAGGCSCIDGFWTCSCACYGAQTTCPIDWCNEPPPRIEGSPCTDVGRICTDFPAVGCECRQDPTEEQATIHCSN